MYSYKYIVESHLFDQRFGRLNSFAVCFILIKSHRAKKVQPFYVYISYEYGICVCITVSVHPFLYVYVFQ